MGRGGRLGAFRGFRGERFRGLCVFFYFKVQWV